MKLDVLIFSFYFSVEEILFLLLIVRKIIINLIFYAHLFVRLDISFEHIFFGWILWFMFVHSFYSMGNNFHSSSCLWCISFYFILIFISFFSSISILNIIYCYHFLHKLTAFLEIGIFYEMRHRSPKSNNEKLIIFRTSIKHEIRYSLIRKLWFSLFYGLKSKILVGKYTKV